MGGALALVGSPRRLGNFYLAARHIAWAGGIEELKIIRLQSKIFSHAKPATHASRENAPSKTITPLSSGSGIRRFMETRGD